MAFRFQRRMKIMPGVALNLSKSGVSLSVGPKGATVNVGRGRPKLTVGVPGTGLSRTQAFGDVPEQKTALAPVKSRWRWVLYFAIFFAWLYFLQKVR